MGAAAGGAVLSLGMSYVMVSITGALLTALGLLLVGLQMRLPEANLQYSSKS